MVYWETDTKGRIWLAPGMGRTEYTDSIFVADTRLMDIECAVKLHLHGRRLAALCPRAQRAPQSAPFAFSLLAFGP